MTTDFATVFWKEWKEILLEHGSSGRGRRPWMMVGLIGIVLPLLMDAQKYFGPQSLMMLVFVSFAAVLAVVPDAFAGERERHTLETLLASRLPDRAILLGKLAACLAYGWLLSIMAIVFGVMTVNVKNWNGHVLFYPDAASRLCLVLLPLLIGGVMASTGVFVSLRAATVRQAQQTLMFVIMGTALAIGFGVPALPANVRFWFARNLVIRSAAGTVLAASALILAIDLVLVLAALRRFQRSKLVFD
jgi:ABC-2 type transport system permease protein